MKKRDYEFLDDKSRALMHEPLWGSSLLLIAIAIMFAVILLWAAFFEINDHVVAIGKIIPSSRVQEIQNLEGGIIEKIFVHEGQAVKKGQLLIKIDDTQYRSAYKREEVRYYTFLAKKTRLEAEVNDQTEINFPEELKKDYPALVANETKLFTANRNNFQAKMNSLMKSYQLADEQLKMTEPLVKKGLLAQFDLLRIQKEVNEIQGNIEVTKETYYSETRTQLTDVKAELDGSEKQLVSLKDRITRSEIIAPVDGIVKKINFDTIGAVIKPGEDMLEIVPVDDHLLIEAKVLPSDIGFIAENQSANVKITAYDSTIYGSLPGKVAYISADSISEKTADGREMNYFRVIVKTNVNYIDFKGKKLSIIPGMEASVDILTGKRTVLQYILKPLIKAKQNVFGTN